MKSQLLNLHYAGDLVVDGEEASEPVAQLDFELVTDGDTFTLIPSDDSHPYYYWVFYEDEYFDYAEVYGMAYVLNAYVAYAAPEEIFTGTQSDTAQNWYIAGEYGTYYICVGGVTTTDEGYAIDTNVTELVWHYTDIPTGIETLGAESAKPQRKAMIGGRVVLDGRYHLDGTIAQ